MQFNTLYEKFEKVNGKEAYNDEKNIVSPFYKKMHAQHYLGANLVNTNYFLNPANFRRVALFEQMFFQKKG